MDLVFYFHIGRSGVGSAPLFDICQDLCTHVSQRLFIHRFSAHSFLVHRWMYLTTSFLTGHPICKNLRRTRLLRGAPRVFAHAFERSEHHLLSAKNGYPFIPPIGVAHGRRVADNDQSSTLWFGVPLSGAGVFHTGTFLRSPQGIVERKEFPALSQLREVRTAEYAVVAYGRRVADSD